MTLEQGEQQSPRAAVRDMPLVGISMDDHDGEDQIVIMLGDQPDRNATHIIAKPTQARIVDSSSEQEEVMEIEAVGGSRTVVRCRATQSDVASRDESGMPGGGTGRKDEIGHSGVYPMLRAAGASANAPLQGEASWGQGERGAAGYFDHGDSELNLRKKNE